MRRGAASLLAGRFELGPLIGHGGMGDVYEGRDSESGHVVAIKRLRHVAPRSVSRFKREFRALSEIRHPNIVALYELIQDGSDWAIVMEKIEGVPFGVGRQPTSHPVSVTGPTVRQSLHVTSSPAHTRWPAGAEQIVQVRLLLPQLVIGLRALHDAGLVHRDIKPGNLIVERQTGRLVILDAGIACQMQETGELAGTPKYMAPEQGDGVPSPASDWYAVGVLLHQVLVGVPPFVGPPRLLLAAKRSLEPRRLADDPELPADLAHIADRLLSRDPSERMTGPELMRALGIWRRRRRPSSRPPDDLPIIGQSSSVAAIERTLEQTLGGENTLLLLEGTAGSGKTAIFHHMSRRARERGFLVVGARCRARESVPHGAVDAFMEALVLALKDWPRSELAAMIPRGGDALLRLSPAFRHLLGDADGRSDDAGGDESQRLRAYQELSELLVELSRRRPMAFLLDDLHWCDAASTVAFAAMLRTPGAHRVASMATFCEPIWADPRLVFRALDALRSSTDHVAIIRSQVEALSDAESAELARRMPVEDPEIFARDAHGNPRLIVAAGGRGRRFDQALERWLAECSPGARQLFGVVSRASGPVRIGEALRTADLADGRPELLELQTKNLVRVSGFRSENLVDTYHAALRAATCKGDCRGIAI